MALTAESKRPQREGKNYSYPVAASTTIYKGGLVCLNSSGYAVPGSASTTLVAVGRAEETVVNSGTAGSVNVEVLEGVFKFTNSSSTDAITIAEIGDAVYIVDDDVVAKTSNGGTRSVAGWCVDVESDGVWVHVKNIASHDGDLVAANNLSDVASAATARSNIGANDVVLSIPEVALDGTDTYYVACPVSGTITKIYSVIDGALGTGDATLTAKIGITSITDGVITITESGSSAGDVDVATPSALNSVTEGQYIAVTVGGSNSAAQKANVSILVKT